MKTVIITGANRGIGLELTKIYAKECEVIATCRKTSDELESLNVTVVENIDVERDESHEVLLNVLQSKKIDLLIHNAGIFTNETLDNLDFSAIQKQLEVNAIAPLKMTSKLLGSMNSPSKIIFITSRMGSITDNGSGSYYGYRGSKTLINSFAKSLSVDLKHKGISVGLMHPGYVQTKMTNFHGDITPDIAAKGISQNISHLSLENTGGFWHSNGEELPW